MEMEISRLDGRFFSLTMGALRLLPSDPLYPSWDWLLTVRAAFLNAACHADLAGMPEPERAAAVAELTAAAEQAWQELAR